MQVPLRKTRKQIQRLQNPFLICLALLPEIRSFRSLSEAFRVGVKKFTKGFNAPENPKDSHFYDFNAFYAL